MLYEIDSCESASAQSLDGFEILIEAFVGNDSIETVVTIVGLLLVPESYSNLLRVAFVMHQHALNAPITQLTVRSHHRLYLALHLQIENLVWLAAIRK